MMSPAIRELRGRQPRLEMLAGVAAIERRPNGAAKRELPLVSPAIAGQLALLGLSLLVVAQRTNQPRREVNRPPRLRRLRRTRNALSSHS